MVAKREAVGAHYGLRDWLVQRVTAVLMALYTVYLAALVLALPRLDYWHWKALWQLPEVRYTTLLVVLALLLHAWVGMRNIFMDYVKDAGLRLVLYVAVILVLAFYGLWSVRILWAA
jgi:succinate dehydrogenase / fumarate reductase membrane anchor subunit